MRKPNWKLTYVHKVNQKRLPGLSGLRILMWLPAFLMCLLLPRSAMAQGCGTGVPSYVVNLSANADTSWSTTVARNGKCCSASGSDRCIYFKLTLHPDAIGIRIDVSGGTGGTNYYLGCSLAGTAGTVHCLSGTGPFDITYCKPGGNAQTYTITSIRRPTAPDAMYVGQGCSTKLSVTGLVTSSITWTAITNSSYNSYLSCSTACATPTVSAGTGFPSFVDYQVCGTPQAACAGTTFCDTIRVYRAQAPTVEIYPSNPKICPGSTNTPLSAVATNGRPIYKYMWNSGATTPTINAGTGTWWVRVTDSLNCQVDYDTVVVTYQAAITVDAGSNIKVCANTNRAQLNGTVTTATGGRWSGGTGKFTPNDSTLNAKYVPSSAEAAAGFVWLKLTTTGNGNCAAKTDSVKITIDPMPTPVISGPGSLCEGTAGTYSVPAVSGNTYSWMVLGGTIASGQGTNSISVDWSSSGPGYVYITQTNAAGCSNTIGYNTLARMDFNTADLTKASVGYDASSYNTDYYSNGTGYTVNTNCGGTQGANLVVPSGGMSQGKMITSFNMQRDEGDAEMIERGNWKLYMAGGTLMVRYAVSNGSGGSTVVGPLNTGYSVPNDDVFRIYSFAYDSATGIARIYVNSAQVWSNTTTAGRSLDWASAGDYKFGGIMDGNCSNQSLMDFAMVAAPITVVPKPIASITGTATVCEYTEYTYTAPFFASGYSYAWTVTGGTVTGSAITSTAKVKWGVPGNGLLTMTMTNTATGCKTVVNLPVAVTAKPAAKLINHY